MLLLFLLPLVLLLLLLLLPLLLILLLLPLLPLLLLLRTLDVTNAIFIVFFFLFFVFSFEVLRSLLKRVDVTGKVHNAQSFAGLGGEHDHHLFERPPVLGSQDDQTLLLLLHWIPIRGGVPQSLMGPCRI